MKDKFNVKGTATGRFLHNGIPESHKLPEIKDINHIPRTEHDRSAQALHNEIDMSKLESSFAEIFGS